MQRFVLLSLLGIAVLLGGSLAVILWMTDPGPALPPPEPAPAPVVAQPEKRPPVVVAPLPEVKASDVEAFEKPVPRSVPEPPAGPPPVDLAEQTRALESVVSSKCGRMQVRLGDEMRKGDEQITGQAVLLFDAETTAGRVKLGQSRLQSPGNMRQSLVACAQMALRGQEFGAPGAQPDQRFTLQVVLGMKE